MSTATYPREGIRLHTNSHGITILRLHYTADEEKGSGPATLVPEINRSLSPWALAQFGQMTDPTAYLREYEIDAESALGSKIFQLDEEATLEPSFPIPQTWTRRMGLDPHPSVPHAFLWCATDTWGDRWYYRELWPSRACYRYDGGLLLGKAGPCPPDDIVVTIRDYVETVKWLESSGNAENSSGDIAFDEKLSARVIDYAMRAFGLGTNDDAEQPNFQMRYEHFMQLPETKLSCSVFQDAKKDRDVGFEVVNSGLKPRMVMGSDGEQKKRSRIHIFRDKCPELIYELKNARRQMLTPSQVETQDPTGKPVEVRMHMADCFRYLEMSNPIYLNPVPPKSTWKPREDGIAY